MMIRIRTIRPPPMYMLPPFTLTVPARGRVKPAPTPQPAVQTRAAAAKLVSVLVRVRSGGPARRRRPPLARRHVTVGVGLGHRLARRRHTRAAGPALSPG